MNKYLFRTLFVVYLFVLATLGFKTVNYVKIVLQDYEASQPEKVVEAEMERLKEAVANDTTESVITFRDIEQAEYDIDISDFRESQGCSHPATLPGCRRHGAPAASGQYTPGFPPAV